MYREGLGLALTRKMWTRGVQVRNKMAFYKREWQVCLHFESGKIHAKRARPIYSLPSSSAFPNFDELSPSRALFRLVVQLLDVHCSNCEAHYGMDGWAEGSVGWRGEED